MRIREIGQVACAAFLLVVLPLFVACGDDEGEVAILECTGTCTCDNDTRTCSCAGGTDCVLEGEGQVTFTCDGNASCGLSCGDDCNVVCPGTTGCNAESGARARFECQGTAACEFRCHADCAVFCGGTSQCLVTCDDVNACDLSACRNSTDCGGGIFACGRECP
jgi:hypothetical protein